MKFLNFVHPKNTFEYFEAGRSLRSLLAHASGGGWRPAGPRKNRRIQGIIPVPGLWQVGVIHSRKTHLTTFHRHPGAYEIYFVAGGRMEFRLGETVLFLRGGEAVLVPPGLPHATANEKLLSEPAHLYWMVLSPKNFLGLPSSVTHPLFRQLAGLSGKIHRPRSEIKSIFEELLESLSKKSPTNQSEIIAHALRLSLAFSRGTFSSTPKKNALLLQKIQSLLLADSGEKAVAFNPTGSLGSVGAIAEKLNLESRTLARRFKREQGMDLKDFILRTKIEAAKKSLLETSTPLTDIAHRLGFSSSAHFSTAFRRLTSVSPLSFRRNSTIL